MAVAHGANVSPTKRWRMLNKVSNMTLVLRSVKTSEVEFIVKGEFLSVANGVRGLKVGLFHMH